MENSTAQILNKIFFTEKDNNISGASQRDPLGLQPIWSFYGRRVINHLTTISTNIHGFREVLLCLSICTDIRKINSNFSYQDLILLFEQLFIYTSISKQRIEGILGADNGNSKFITNNGNPEISCTHTILVREISLGYYGRYKTPLSTMGIINAKSELQIDSNQVKSLYGESLYNEIFSSFKSFISLTQKKFNSYKAKDALYAAIFGKFRNGERDFWINMLYESDNEKKELMQLCYESADTYTETKDLFNSLSEKEEVRDILKLEPFLRCLENIFYKAMSSKDIKSVSIENLDEHEKRYNEFCTISNLSDSTLFSERMKYLKDNCSPKSSDYIKKVIEYHKRVCEQKKSSVWLELDSEGRLQAFVNVDDIDIDIMKWCRDYYLSSLKSIKSEILEFSK